MNYISFLVYVSIRSLISAKVYQKSTSECRFKNNIYKSAKVSSPMDCSVLCNQELCSRFIYDNSSNMCELHSDAITPELVETPSGTSAFLSTHTGCNVPGYDFVESYNLCIKWYGGLYTWREGRALCQQDGGDLLTLDKIEKWNFIYQHLGSCPKKRIWLGLIDQTWINGVPFQDVYGVTSLVDNTDHDKSCVRLKLNATNFVFNDNNCMDSHMVFCEIPVHN